MADPNLLSSFLSFYRDQPPEPQGPSPGLPARDPDHDQWSSTGRLPSAGVPDHKKDLIDQADWDGFNTALAGLDGVTPLQQYIAARIYAEEGGKRWNGSKSAFAGLQENGLAEAQKRDPVLGGVKLGEAMTHEQIARAYLANIAAGAQRYGGLEELAKLQHDDTVAAIADTQFRHGQNDGALAIREAVDKAKGRLPPDVAATLNLPALNVGKTGPKDTFDQIRKLNEAGYGTLFRGALADRRAYLWGESEKSRYDGYR
ncbi:MAG: hypothetical protein VW600_02700 [Ferrovibrio sp.]